MRYFSQKQLISKEISFHALIKKSYHKWFCHIMAKIRRAKRDGNVRVAELNRVILGALNFCGLALSGLWGSLWALSRAEGSARAPCLPGLSSCGASLALGLWFRSSCGRLPRFILILDLGSLWLPFVAAFTVLGGY